jgi:ribosomal protein S12 methylthiotransferase
MDFYLHKLGCPKNDVDADYLAGRLIADGHRPVEWPDDADVLIVNTCGFIDEAKEESIDRLLELGLYRDYAGHRKLFVTGCLAQRYADELRDEIPEIDGIFGLGEWDQIAAAMSAERGKVPTAITDSRMLSFKAGEHRYISDQNPYAYLKISDGCDRNCSYCVIPSIRGHFRSRTMESILREARHLAENGKRELILVSQDTTLYGRDLNDGSNLIDLLKALDEVSGVDWIRAMYLHPAQVGQELIEYLGAPDNKTLSYFDLPLQHIDSRLLQAMNRPYDERRVRQLIDSIRQADPAATIRSTFIVGFPGESELQFERLLEFLEEMQLERAAAFAYSRQDDTPAARLPGQLPEELQLQRLDDLMVTQSEIALDKNDSLIGSTVEVMLDRLFGGNKAIARTRGDCPEIDQEVIVSGPGLEVGQIVNVEIVAVDGYDLVGKVAQD